jgi:uncharacterized protein (DUF2062 family)
MKILRILFRKFRQKVLIPFKIIPKDGLSNQKIALSVTIGIVSGIFPVIGGTTAVGLLLLAAMKQNLVTVQAVSWLMSPIQLLSIIPFMRTGAWILHKSPVHITLNQIMLAFEPGWWMGLKNLGILHLYAALAWAVFALPAGFVLYYSALAITSLMNRKKLVPVEELVDTL